MNSRAFTRFVLLLSMVAFIARGQKAACFPRGAEMGPAGDMEEPVAVHMGDARILSWAVSCEIERGPGWITYPDSIEVTAGEAGFATGPAGNGTVSLGDGGRATLRFEQPICDGPGTDFAVFENSFDGSFLELGFVEVSSDGERFVRFPSTSLTPADVQVEPFGTLDPGLIFNLAGKDPVGWGTPFDLEELKDSGGLDIGTVVAVRIVDVIGILDEDLGSRDAAGRLINDPFPTPFESGGFDLDAVGVIHQVTASMADPAVENPIKIYPLPCQSELYLEEKGLTYRHWALLDIRGQVIRQGRMSAGTQRIGLEDVPGGSYILRFDAPHAVEVKRILKIH